MWSLLVACSSESTPPLPPNTPCDLVGAPALSSDPDAPLARALTAQTSRSCALRVTWDDGSRVRTKTSLPGTEHELILAGMLSDTLVTVELSIQDRLGSFVPAYQTSFRTDPLPAIFPDIVVHTSEADRLEPGDTLVSMFATTATYNAVLSPQGEVIWLYKGPMLFLETQPDDHLLGLVMFGDVLEIDWAGRERTRFTPGGGERGILVDVPNFHHEVQRLDDGTYVAFSGSGQLIPDYPVSYDDPSLRAETLVFVDEIVHFAPSGEVLYRRPLSSVIPIDRLGYDSLNPVLDAIDWSHCNNITVDPSDQGWIVSSRHQDTVFKLDPVSNTVRWILAPPANWPPHLEALRLQPVGDIAWPYHQHGPEMLADGTLLLFDNGNYRASPWTGEEPLGNEETWSRVVALSIDETQRTVSERWSFQLPEERLWSGAFGDVDLLPETGNVLSTWGYVVYSNGQALGALGFGKTVERIIEFDPDTGEPLLDIEISSSADIAETGWSGFRAQRIPPL